MAPDVVIVHCHDLGTWLSAYGLRGVPDPHLQRFAEESVVFDNAFSAAPLCSPARAALFTGKSPHVNGVQGLAHQKWRYRTDVRTLPELLADAGYHSVLVGLQHEHTNPAVLGYDEVVGQGFLPRTLPVAAAAAEYLADRATNGPGNQPLLMVVGMWEVHRPWPAEDYVPDPPDAVDVPAFLSDNDMTRADIAAFHGSIRQMDAGVGQLLHAIDRYTDPDNTVVIFTTDHGPAFPRAKGTLYDPGVHVALMVRPPRGWGIAPGRRHALVSHLDVVPTLLDIAGRPRAGGLEGTSLRSILVEDLGADQDDRSLYFEKSYHDTYDPIRAVRTRRYKLIRNFLPGTPVPISKDIADSLTFAGMSERDFPIRPPVELFDLANDPAERVNLAGSETHRSAQDRLQAQLDNWMTATADPLVDGAIPEPPPQSRQSDALPALAVAQTTMAQVPNLRRRPSV